MTFQDDALIQQVIAWAETQPTIHAVILTSTRARPDAVLDPFSDYDIILAVDAVWPFHVDRGWLEAFGTVLALYRDPIRRDCGYEQFGYVTQYEHDRLKIDFTVLEADLLRTLPSDCDLRDELDAGYAVLLDKDGVTANLPAPTYHAYIPTPPSAETYHEAVEIFFHEATYVAKNIWRDELLPAKYSFDQEMKQMMLGRMLVWRMEIEHGWTIRPGVLGKGLKRRTPPELWQQLEATYVGAGAAENWDALFRLIALYRQVAIEVGNGLGYAYPHALDARACAYLESVRSLPRAENEG